MGGFACSLQAYFGELAAQTKSRLQITPVSYGFLNYFFLKLHKLMRKAEREEKYEISDPLTHFSNAQNIQVSGK